VGATAALCAGLAVLGLAPPPARADPVRDAQWQLSELDTGAAWDTSTGAGVIVAVLDSGVDADHPDLTDQVLAGADFVDGTTDGRTDPVGHGTSVAALIAGRDDDNAGVEGIAPDAKILPVRVLDELNRYDDATTVADGLRWAVDHGARVVNMSLGGSVHSDALASAIGYAYAHDVVVVACTGNEEPGAPTDVWYPAREPGVVAVAGLARAGDPGSAASAVPGGGPAPASAAGTGVAPWPGGLTGPYTVLSAPATDLLGAKPGGYWRVQGTSFAAPLVAASAALIRARWPTMDAANVINRLIRTADDLGPAGRDPRYGYGEVDPARALSAIGIRPVTGNPLLGPAAATEPASAPARGASAPPAAGAGGPASGRPVRSRPPPTGALAGDANRTPRWRLAVCGWAAVATLCAGLIMLRRRLTRR
jgi:type VII secretion-associated serine protease mycosin